MRFKLKILGIILLILIILLISLTVVYSISLIINANHPFKAELVKIHEWTGNVNYIGYFIAIVTALTAFLFPISLTIVNDIGTTSDFESDEISDIVFSSIGYRMLKINFLILIIFSIQSFFTQFYWEQTFFNLILLLISMFYSFKYINDLESFISDFSIAVRERERREIDQMLNNG